MTDRTPRTTYLFGRMDRIVRRELEEIVRDQNVTVLGFTALTVLDGRPGLSNAQLARRSFMSPQGMYQATAALLEQGLVRRHPDATNRRVLRLELTPKGAAVVQTCTARIDEIEGDLFAALDHEERVVLDELLRKVIDGARQTSTVV